MPINIPEVVEETLAVTPFIDIHTHLFAPAFGDLGLWGIDELLTYHYLEAELFRFSSIAPDQYFALDKQRKADLIWQTLFVENGPLSEATRGVVAVLDALGLDTACTSLEPLRQFFRGQDIAEYVPRVFRLAGIDSAVMTNDPLDPVEAAYWGADVERDPMFHAALRLDRIVNEWGSSRTPSEVRGFIETWATRMKPVYMAISLPDTFQFPVDGLLAEAVIPVCQDRNIPLSLMIGVRRNVNPALGLAGDASGRCDLRWLETLCTKFPRQRFLISVLSRENQHELCVYARKFSNLMPFGCWWFLNNPSIVEEITRERIEMLGTSFIPQHSDARVLEQLIYKWRNTRRTLAPILAKSYELLVEDGRDVTPDNVRRDVTRLFRTNFEEWTGLGN
jgi:hypothetical protein